MTGSFGLHSVGHFKRAFEQRAFEAGHDLPQIETLRKQPCKLLYSEFTVGRAGRRRGGLQMEILGLQFSVLAQDQSPLQQVPQFPDVSRKCIRLQLCQSLGADRS